MRGISPKRYGFRNDGYPLSGPPVVVNVDMPFGPVFFKPSYFDFLTSSTLLTRGAPEPFTVPPPPPEQVRPCVYGVPIDAQDALDGGQCEMTGVIAPASKLKMVSGKRVVDGFPGEGDRW